VSVPRKVSGSDIFGYRTWSSARMTAYDRAKSLNPPLAHGVSYPFDSFRTAGPAADSEAPGGNTTKAPLLGSTLPFASASLLVVRGAVCVPRRARPPHLGSSGSLGLRYNLELQAGRFENLGEAT